MAIPLRSIATGEGNVGLSDMHENEPKSVKQRSLVISTISAVFLLFSIIFYFFLSKRLGVILVILTGIFFSYGFSRLSINEKQSIVEAAEKYDRSIFGKIGKLLSYALIGYLLYALITTSIK